MHQETSEDERDSVEQMATELMRDKELEFESASGLWDIYHNPNDFISRFFGVVWHNPDHRYLTSVIKMAAEMALESMNWGYEDEGDYEQELIDELRYPDDLSFYGQSRALRQLERDERQAQKPLHSKQSYWRGVPVSWKDFHNGDRRQWERGIIRRQCAELRGQRRFVTGFRGQQIDTWETLRAQMRVSKQTPFTRPEPIEWELEQLDRAQEEAWQEDRSFEIQVEPRGVCHKCALWYNTWTEYCEDHSSLPTMVGMNPEEAERYECEYLEDVAYEPEYLDDHIEDLDFEWRNWLKDEFIAQTPCNLGRHHLLQSRWEAQNPELYPDVVDQMDDDWWDESYGDDDSWLIEDEPCFESCTCHFCSVRRKRKAREAYTRKLYEQHPRDLDDMGPEDFGLSAHELREDLLYGGTYRQPDEKGWKGPQFARHKRGVNPRELRRLRRKRMLA